VRPTGASSGTQECSGLPPNLLRRWFTRITDRCPIEKRGLVVVSGILGLTNWSIPLKSDTYSDSSTPLPATISSITYVSGATLAGLTLSRRNTTNPGRSPDSARHTSRPRFRDSADSAHETNAREPIQGLRRRPTGSSWLGERGNTPSLLGRLQFYDCTAPRPRRPVCAIRRRGSFCGFKKLPPRSTP